MCLHTVYAVFSEIVHEKLFDDILQRLKRAYAQVPIGDPLEPGTLYGPIHSQLGIEGYKKALSDAQAQGGKIEIGGKVCTFTCVKMYIAFLDKTFGNRSVTDFG